MSAMNKDHLSVAMNRTTQWICQEIPSDITVHVSGASFPLHKFPLMTRCGYIRRLEPKSTDYIKIPDIPGGAKSFELAAKFCYEISFEITLQNIAMLRCAAEYLEMTEEIHVRNLKSCTEEYLNEVALKTPAGAISVLRSTYSLLPFAEDLKLVIRCIDSIASAACKYEKDLTAVFSSNQINSNLEWVEELMLLSINFFQRVISAIWERGFNQYAVCPLIMLYAQKSLHGLEDVGMEKTEEREKRAVLETILSLLPRDKNVIPVSFLSMLLRAAISLETTIACRFDLENMISLKLNDAVLDDLYFPLNSNTRSTVLDVDAVYRIMTKFLNSSSSEFEMDCVTSLMESYLIEIASEKNLSVPKFVDFSKIIPEQAKTNDDRIYTAVDIYLKVHKDLSETEKRTLCGTINCQKLSQEACLHASQNNRLPVQIMIQVLFAGQSHLREALELKETLTSTVKSHSTDNMPSDILHENEMLKIELQNMKMKLKEIEKNRRRLSQNSFIGLVTRKIGWLYPFARERVTPPNVQGCNYVRRTRRFPIS